jgi:hypothetical protein
MNTTIIPVQLAVIVCTQSGILSLDRRLYQLPDLNQPNKHKLGDEKAPGGTQSCSRLGSGEIGSQ